MSQPPPARFRPYLQRQTPPEAYKLSNPQHLRPFRNVPTPTILQGRCTLCIYNCDVTTKHSVVWFVVVIVCLGVCMLCILLCKNYVITSTFYASFFLGDSEDPEEEVGRDFQIEDSFNKPIAPISDYASTSPQCTHKAFEDFTGKLLTISYILSAVCFKIK